jgi:3-oxoacyl-[acyl-carrier protein] reductase
MIYSFNIIILIYIYIEEEAKMSKIILITGASTGLGAETARLLAFQNEIIVHYYSSQKEAEKVAADVEIKGGKSFLVQADLSQEEGCLKLFNTVTEKFPKLDVLVNNAGGLIRREAAKELEWKLMMETFSLNTFSTMKLSSLFIPWLEKGNNPCIINISSIAMRHGAPGATIYGACKGAIDSFTRGLAHELAPTIRVNAVSPGVIDTPFHKKVSTPEKMKKFKELTPLKQIGEAIHIAKTIEFLINNDFITGETIDVNGGLFMR